MIWKDGFTAAYYMTFVDPKSWRDIGRMEITSGSIDRSEGDLLESADVTTTELPEDGETWIRIWLDAEQGGVEHIPLFTGLTSAPTRDIDGMRETYQIDCYSVLKPIDDILLERGFYVPADVTAPTAAARLLQTGIAPVRVDYSSEMPRLTESVVAEDGESSLTLAWKVLDAIDWTLKIDGMGVIHIQPRNEEVIALFDVEHNDIIELAITDEYDWFSCPNVLRAIADDLTAVAKDEDPDSPLSIVGRGREIWAEETSVTLGTNESLAAYAQRRLKELQSPARSVSYARRFAPAIGVGDVVMINHPQIKINGRFRITSQSLDLSYGCRTSEEATQI